MMMGRDSGAPAVAGGPAPHIPVLARPVADFLAVRPDGIYLDGTFGAGGHSRAMLAAGATVIGLDRDPSAVARGAELIEAAGGRLTLFEARFSQLEAVASSLGHDAVNGVLLDLGVSSMQLDEAGRGFSFRHDGPLDMRMGGSGPSAADVVRFATERELTTIIATLGEERHARAVARAIVAARRDAPITTTGELAAIVSRVVRTKPGDIDPATRTFQALRIFVNEELDELVDALDAAERILKPGGRLVVISFHSLEDRIVKTFLTARGREARGSRHLPEIAHAPPSFRPLTRRPVTADAAEVAANPRSRSAKLRAAERNAAPAVGGAVTGLRLPSLAEIARPR
jgi:16S rRNA (cytosine1402-N4)-methyltransferase